jgi:putative Mg2+ transporter-C (MgtC) family protein
MISIEQAILNLAVALGLSAAIGFERQWRNRLAGLRTNTLVALGAASFVIFEQLIPDESSPTAWPRRWSPASDFSARA